MSRIAGQALTAGTVAAGTAAARWDAGRPTQRLAAVPGRPALVTGTGAVLGSGDTVTSGGPAEVAETPPDAGAIAAAFGSRRLPCKAAQGRTRQTAPEATQEPAPGDVPGRQALGQLIEARPVHATCLPRRHAAPARS